MQSDDSIMRIKSDETRASMHKLVHNAETKDLGGAISHPARYAGGQTWYPWDMLEIPAASREYRISCPCCGDTLDVRVTATAVYLSRANQSDRSTPHASPISPSQANHTPPQAIVSASESEK